MEYRYYKDNVMFLGKMSSGKTYNARILLSKVPKENILILDSHDEYKDFEPCLKRILPRKPYTAAWVDNLIKEAYKYYHKVAVFDDLDLYIKYDRESSQLADFFIGGSSHNEIGSITISKRCVSLDKRILQNARWIFLMRGVVRVDAERIQNECGLDDGILTMYEEKVFKSLDEQHAFILIDNNTKTYKFLKNLVM